MDKQALAVDRMYTDIEWALSQGLTESELVPMVERLLREAPAQSLHLNYAKRQLAELIVRHHPFRAARLAREVLEQDSDDDRAHGVLGLSYLLMGHFHLAERSYRRALSLVPHCPWYAHNLGHLLDVALDRPQEALGLLAMSHRALPDAPELSSSYAHALFRTGHQQEAWKHLLEALDGNHCRAQRMLDDWRESEPST